MGQRSVGPGETSGILSTINIKKNKEPREASEASSRPEEGKSQPREGGWLPQGHTGRAQQSPEQLCPQHLPTPGPAPPGPSPRQETFRLWPLTVPPAQAARQCPAGPHTVHSASCSHPSTGRVSTSGPARSWLLSKSGHLLPLERKRFPGVLWPRHSYAHMAATRLGNAGHRPALAMAERGDH